MGLHNLVQDVCRPNELEEGLTRSSHEYRYERGKDIIRKVLNKWSQENVKTKTCLLNSSHKTFLGQQSGLSISVKKHHISLVFSRNDTAREVMLQ